MRMIRQQNGWIVKCRR